MNNDYMRYSREKLVRCADMLKAYIAISKQYHKKSEYAALSFELKKVNDFAERELNSVLFEYECSPVRNFVNIAFKYKDYKRDEILDAEKTAMRYLANELNSILRLINSDPAKYEKVAEL